MYFAGQVLCLLIFNRAWEEKILEAQESNSSLNVYCNLISFCLSSEVYVVGN